ncbi:MAG TPA: hypothetical protein VFN11_22695 [Ktedonobacterales bacterium]|nr:hypothetical protein [Ktedonobacterales bacterium]
MSCSGSDHDDKGMVETLLETMPLELLPLHQGLEEDGSSWRATLPLPDDLLRRVRIQPPVNRFDNHIHAAANDAQSSSPPQWPSLRHHRRCRHQRH